MIVIVGAGPAGIAAALTVRKFGLAVTVIDDNPAPGGQIWRGDPARRTTLESAGAVVLCGTRVVAVSPEDRTVLVEDATASRQIAFSKLILATGSRELFLPFPGWTLPGAFGAGGLQAVVKSGLPVRGKRIVVAGTGPLLLAVAALLRKNGANVVLIAEQAPFSAVANFSKALLTDVRKLLQAAGLAWTVAGIPYVNDCWVEAAEGDVCVRRVRLRRGDSRWTEECDFVAVGYGLVPNDELHKLAGTHSHIFRAETGDVDFASLAGTRAALEAMGREELAPDLSKAAKFAGVIGKSFALRSELRALAAPDTIVCRCEDVRCESLRQWPSFRAAKLQTRCGMGPCQGRICGAAAGFLFGWEDTSVRPPAFPARIATLSASPDTKGGNQ